MRYIYIFISDWRGS